MSEVQTKEPSFLDSLKSTKETVQGPQFGIIYGGDGVGKTTICKFAPNPHFISVEKGVEKVRGVGKFIMEDANGKEFVYMPKTKDEFFHMVARFTKRKHEYKTVVVDSGMFVDKLFIADVIAKNPTVTNKNGTKVVTSIGDYDFMAGYEKVQDIWVNDFFVAVDVLHRKDINVILIAHSRLKDTLDKNGDKFPKHQIDMLEFGSVSIPRLLSNKADFVFFMEAEVETAKKNNPFGPARTVAVDDEPQNIKLYTRKTSRFNAKVRAEIAANVQNCYEIDIYDDSTSQKVFDDIGLK